jgi:hypothetical protein
LEAPPAEDLLDAAAAAADEADCELLESVPVAEVVEPDPAAPEFDIDIESVVEVCVDDDV